MIALLALAATAGAMPADLAAAVARYDRATVTKDIPALSAIVTNDYFLVNSDGSTQGKASYLADFQVPDFTIEPYAVREPLVRRVGDGALTGGTMRLSWTLHGRHVTRDLRVVHFWVRQGQQWRLAYSQLTRTGQ
jgi:ketosteroid isomerase-like protein